MAASTDVISGGKRRGGGRRVVPLLPAQQSPSERVAHNKNRVLHRRLQLHLNTLTKHRRSWLLQTHIQATRYRQRAEHLHHLITPSHSPTSDPSLPHHPPFSCHDLTSARDDCTRHSKSRNQRPATSVHFRFSGPRGRDDKRPSTAVAHPRSQPVEAWSDCRKPLSSTRDNKMTPSSDEDDADSEDSAALTDDSENDDGDDGAGKTARFDKTAPTVHTYLSGNNQSGHSLVKKQTQSRARSAFIRTPQLLPASNVMGDTTGRPRTEPHSHTGRDSQKRADENHQKQFLGRPGSFRQRAQTAPGTSRSCKAVARSPCGSGGRVVQSGGGGGGGSIFGCGRGPRDANYIRYVLNQERDKYELSQMKVRHYLQSLKI